MALSKQAAALKQRLSAVVELRRALAAAQQEWDELISLEEGLSVAARWAEELHAERYALQKELAQAQLNNWVILRAGAPREVEWRILRLRYVQGLAWREIIARTGQSKTYLLRLHNRALEKIAKAPREKNG